MTTKQVTVEIQEKTITKQTRYGPVEKPHPMDFVLVNGIHAGYCPHDPKDSGHKVFHPLTGFPEGLCEEVVRQSSGRMTRSLRAPVLPAVQEDANDQGDEDE